MPSPDDEFIAKVPKQLKEDIGSFYVMARSNDPRIKIQHTRNLISSLQAAMIISGCTKYNEMLVLCKQVSIDALAFYINDNWAAGVADCDNVLDEVTFLVYDGWGLLAAQSFKMPVPEQK